MGRRRASSLAALLALACASGAPAALTEMERSTIEREVAAAMDSLTAAAERQDADGVFGRFAPWVHADDGAVMTRDSLAPAYRALYAATARLDLRMPHRDIRVLSPNAAVVVAEGTFDATGKDGTRQQGRVAWTFLWERATDGWRVLHQHQSFPPMAPPPTASVSGTSAVQEIARQGARHAAAWRRSSVDSTIALYAPDAAVLLQDVPDVRGRAAVREMLAGIFAENRIESLDVTVDTIEVHGAMALEWGTYRQTLQPTNGPAVREAGRYLMQWQRQPDGTWAIRRFTGSSLPRSSS